MVGHTAAVTPPATPRATVSRAISSFTAIARADMPLREVKMTDLCPLLHPDHPTQSVVRWPRPAYFSTSADTSTWCCHLSPAGVCPGSNSIWAWGRSFSSAAATRGSDPDPLARRPDRQATAGQERSIALITSLTCPEPSGRAARACFFGYPCWGSRSHPHRGTPIATFISSVDDSSGEPREDAMGTGNSQPPHRPRPSPAAGALTRRLTILTPTRAVALALIAVLVAGLVYLRFAPGAGPVAVPEGLARAI